MIVLLRDMNLQDLELVLAWRSNNLVYEGAYIQKEPLTWEEHWIWYNSRGPWWKFFIVQVNNGVWTRDIGVVNFGQLDNWNPELNYYLGEVSLWNQGIGRKMLSLGLDWLKEKGYCKVHTTVKDNNERSCGVLSSLGFVIGNIARKNEHYWELELSNICDSTEYTSGRKRL